ncbi:hypothetical protein PR003_g1725 [Phytophthora rubi]|uniref:Uncharacterized protein n=1 Tax=Phytophthora rubi TaxID=129364 RepID=A0A6A3MHS9_9STRA|nr:hypothetical protein PR002_g9365 [Phytophthora rubi]KAE9357533.1 hypothetical protein PR003_g1725 [Phytophthora rubi]
MLVKGLARSSNLATSCSVATLLPGPCSCASEYRHLAMLCPKFPHCRHCSLCPTAGCFKMRIRPYQIILTTPRKNSGQPAIFTVIFHTVDVRESGVHESMSSRSNSAAICS